MNTLHSHVEELTDESPVCCFCAIEGELEEGLLHGFALAADAARSGRKIPTCVDHRIRLSFVADLSEKVDGLFLKKVVAS